MDAVGQRESIKGLVDDRRRAGFHDPAQLFGILHAGGERHRHVRQVHALAQPFNRLQPTHAWHEQVDEDHVGLEPRDHLERARARRTAFDLHAGGRLQREAHDGQQVVVVIDMGNAKGKMGHSTAPRC